jgi:glucose/arabinose dehydrogenase
MVRSTTVVGGVALSVAAALCGPSAAHAQDLAVQVVATGLAAPVYCTAPVGDDNRLFVVQLRRFGNGLIRVVDLRTGQVASGSYLDIGPVGTGAEQGFYSIAFHPEFMTNGYFYVKYCSVGVAGVTAGDVYVVRYRAMGGDPMATAADPASAQIILKVTKPESIHNGGWLGFGPDGYLYLATGDGGNSNDTTGGVSFPPYHTPETGNAQDLTDNILGKVLRLDVNGPDGQPGTADDDGYPADPNRHYTIPPTNPYVGTVNTPELWANGVRNPWRCSFDRETGDFWLGDVGQAEREEINRNVGNQPAINYGWRCLEGTRCTGLAGCSCADPTIAAPVHEYNHTNGCAVVGGYVYRGSAIPWLRGTYFFADFCTVDLFSFRMVGNTKTEFTDRTTELDPAGTITNVTISSFGEDDRGELYLVDQSAGRLLRIVAPGPLVDCNSNGRHDFGDIASGNSADTNTDGIPDECQVLCPADFNQDGGVDGADIEAFFTAWAAGDSAGDVNRDGGVDGADIEAFFIPWEAGGC